MTNMDGAKEKVDFDVWADSEAGHDFPKILGALRPVMEALVRLHADKKGHGAIRPENLIVGDGLVDVEHFEAQQGREATVRDRPYLAPEPGPAPAPPGDVYALAAVMYHAITGQAPIVPERRRKLGKDRLQMPEGLDPSIRDWIINGLDLDPGRRPTVVALYASVYPAPKTVQRHSVNLTVGKPCEIRVDALLKDPIWAWEVKVENGEDIGCAFDSEKNVLSGTPATAGEKMLVLELGLPGRQPVRQEIAITVNPDPDTLWKNLPSNKDDPYYKEDEAKESVGTPDGWMLAASLRGRSHAHEGLFRDDDFRISYHKASGWHFLAAADGAGSAKYSRRGSKIACEHAIDFMERWIGEHRVDVEKAIEALPGQPDAPGVRKLAYSWLAGAAFDARKAIQAEADAKEPKAAARDFATTLLLAAARHTPSGWDIVTFSVGDGGIALVTGGPDGTVKALCTPDSGEFSGQTVFLTAGDVMSNADQIMRRIHTAHEPNLSALVLMTDGVTDPKFPTEASLSDKDCWKCFMNDLGQEPGILKPDNDQAPSQLLKWLSFRSPGNHDDRTIVLLIPRPPKSRAKT